MFWWSNKGRRWRELLLIQVFESTNEAGWESNEESSTGRRKKWVKRRGTNVQADSQTHTYKHRQRSHRQPHHPILSQTGGKMLYFPSKLKCQLILMWKRRVPSTQCTDTQTAFTLTDTSLEFQIPPWPAAVSWWSHAHGSRRDVWVWSGPMSRLIPSVSWRLFLNWDAVVGGCCLKKQKKVLLRKWRWICAD